jgi:hypothetical protein
MNIMTFIRYHPESKASYVLVPNFLDVISLVALNAKGVGLANIVRKRYGRTVFRMIVEFIKFYAVENGAG